MGCRWVGLKVGPWLTSHLEKIAEEYDREPSSVVENVVLIGAAVPADMLRWASVRVCNNCSHNAISSPEKIQ